MTDLSEKFKTAHHLGFEQGRSPDAIYASFCRTIEAMQGKGLFDDGIVNRLNQIPLVIFEMSKANASLEWNKANRDHATVLPFKSCIVVDPLGVVCLLHSKIYHRKDHDQDTIEIFKTIDGDFKKEYTLPEDCIKSKFLTYMESSTKEPLTAGSGTSIVSYASNYPKKLVQLLNTHIFHKFSDMIVYGEQDRFLQEVGLYDAGTAVGTALEELQYLSQPGNYIVMESPNKIRSNSNRIIRAHERQRVRILDPDEMRKVYLSHHTGHHASPLPHLRMGHWRIFKSDRYIHAKGQRVWIDEITVKADEQWEHNGKIYRIMERK